MTRKRVNQIDILSPNPKIKSHQKTINSGRHNFVVIKLLLPILIENENIP